MSLGEEARAPMRSYLPSRWSVGALLIAAVVLGPILSVLWIALFPSENIWPHLISTTLPRYLRNTAMLMGGVGLIAACTGTGAAWLISRYDFPARRALEWLLLLPLAIPAYVGAYALVDFLEYAGPVQTGLRSLFGWQTSRDYWFPEIRSMGAAIIVLAAALYPYVYLLARAAFREQSGSAEEVAQSLGSGAFADAWLSRLLPVLERRRLRLDDEAQHQRAQQQQAPARACSMAPAESETERSGAAVVFVAALWRLGRSCGGVCFSLCLCGGFAFLGRSFLAGGFLGVFLAAALGLGDSDLDRFDAVAGGPLRDTGRLAAAVAQIVKLGAADAALALHFNAFDHRRGERENTLNTFTEGNLANREALIDAAARARNADAFEALDALTVAFLDAHVHRQGVTRGKFRDILVTDNAGKLFSFQLFNHVHRQSPAVGIRGSWSKRRINRGGAPLSTLLRC